jgi:hypothetical protein
MSKAETIFPAAIFVIVAALVAFGYFISQFTWITFVFPFMVGVVLCALCLIELTRPFKNSDSTATSEAPPAPLSMSSLFWMFALIVFLYGLGFVAGPAAYLLACLRANGFSWRLSAGVAAASVAVTWGLFIKVMNVLLPIAPLWMS